MADLRDARLTVADLREADLRGADLTGADLRRADLRGADLTRATLAATVLDRARYDAETKWPAGLTPLLTKAILETPLPTAPARVFEWW